MRAALIQQWLTKRHFMRPPLQEVVLKAEEGLLEGLEMLKHSLEADHLIVGAALREHGRYVHVWVGGGVGVEGDDHLIVGAALREHGRNVHVWVGWLVGGGGPRLGLCWSGMDVLG